MKATTQEKIRKIKKSIESKEDLKEIEKKFFSTKKKKQEFLDRTYTYFNPADLDYLEYIHKVYGKISEFKPLKEKQEEVAVEDIETETNKLTELESSKNGTPNKITKSKKVRKSEDKPKKDFFDFVEDEEKTKDFDFVDEEIEVAEVKKDEEINNPTQLEVAKNDTPNSLTVLENNFFKDENNLKSLIEMVKKYRSQNENLIEVIEAGMVNIPVEAKELELNAILSVRTNKEVYAKIVEMAQKNKAGKGEFLTFILWDFLKRNS